MELAVAEFLAGFGVACAGDALERAVFDDPLGGFDRVFVGGPLIDGGWGTIEEDDGVRGRFAGLFLSAVGAGFDARGLGAVHVVDGPWVVGVGRVAVEGTVGEDGWSGGGERGEGEREE